ncbi:zinc finger protein 827 isoform X1 [Pygocentrus nattereri]|uniref:zinc finger protein 827 isoform X1 n=1 Tax=Pygocentrus nattereri TaxID=42514 RepID=UPI00189189EA|nr:zinc finger protein 827 isoform X1 [Pygocentrus nattereri]
MPRRKQEQPKRLPSHVDPVEEGAVAGGSGEEDGWFGNASDSPSESSYGDVQDEPRVSPQNGTTRPDPDASAEGPAGCPTPVQRRASLDPLGLDARLLTSQDTLSSVVSSLYGDSAQGNLGKPLSSNLRRLLEAGSLKLEGGELVGVRGAGRGTESPPMGLALSPSSHHAQQLSALARRLASSNNNSGNSATSSPASVATVKQEPSDPFGPTDPAGASSTGFVWIGQMADKWPPAASSSSLSPDSAIQKLKAAANAVLQDKSAVASSTSASSSSSSSSSSSVSSVPALGSRQDDAMRFDAFASPFSSQSASSTLAALSKKVSERSQQQHQQQHQQQQQQQQQQAGAPDHQPSAASFLSLISMTSSAALLKEVAARAAGNLLADKKEPSQPPLGLAPSEDVKPLLDRNQKAPTPTQTLDLLLPTTPKGRAKPSSQAGSPEDGGKPFQCPVCGLVIKRKSYWKRHMVIHTGLKSHQCPLCPFRCARKDNLKSHMKVHQHQDRGETFQCELCPFTSSRHFSLKLHMRCHQHFPRPDLKVKEEPSTDTEEGEGSLLGDGGAAGDQVMATEASPSPALSQADGRLLASPGEPSNHVQIKEEPQDVAVTSPFAPLCRERPGSSSSGSLDLPGLKTSPPGPTAASLFSPDITTKTATDLLIKLSAANQKEALKGAFCVKEEPQAEEPLSPPRGPSFSLAQDGPTGPSRPHQEGSPMLTKSSLLSQDINVKVASELLMKLSENNKDTCLQKVTVKAEPMEVDPPSEVAPPPSHLLGFSTLGACEKKEPTAGLPEPLPRPQKDLFSQDISVKMASELLFKLSEKVSKANENKDSTSFGINSPFLDDRFRQSPFSTRSKSSSPAEASSSARAAHQQDSEKALGEAGNGLAQWRINEQLFPCSVCGKVFGRQQTLSRHLSLHTEERKYKCHLCPYAAKCRANLNQHLTIHSVKLVSTDTEHIVTAVTSDGGERKNCPYYYSCRVCGFQTELNAQFVSHMSLHVDKEQWMFSLCCSSCEYVGVDEAEIKAHVNAEHAGLNSRSPLSESKSTSSSLSALSDSLNSSEGGDVTQGNEELKSLLAPPSSASSQSSSGSGTEEKSEKGFECVFCNFVCKTRAMYERHLQIHLITRMFECDICHKFMKTPEQLLEHKKCHTVPAGGLKCPLCVYSTNRPAAMECHLKTHCKPEHRCRICQAAWASQAELERHARAHRLGNHYRCEQCGYLSKTANKLIEHVRVHTGERPFHCDRCSYSCKRKDNLNLHKRLKHAPRQTFGCARCPFTTTHPFVYSRHLKKHQGTEGGAEEGEAQEGMPCLGSGDSHEPLVLLEGGGSSSGGNSSGSSSSSPLMSLSASQALQSVALSISSKQQPDSALAGPHYLSANGASLAARYSDQYRNYDPAHLLIPLTTLFTTRRFTFHSPSPSRCSSPFSSRLWSRPYSQAPPPPSPMSPKHSFLAYLGLTERAKTV